MRIPVRYGSLLLAILAMHLLVPYFEGTTLLGFLVLVLFGVVQVAAVWAVSGSRRRFWEAGSLLVLSQALLWAVQVHPDRTLDLVSVAAWVLFDVYVVVLLLAHLIGAREVTADTVLGGICIYFLVGFAWSGVYLLLERVQPGSFGGLAEIADGNRGRWSDFFFYSFVTLTTLGYGDIVPLTTKARSLATLEAVFGVMYVAVLISRLVGMHMGRQMADDERE